MTIRACLAALASVFASAAVLAPLPAYALLVQPVQIDMRASGPGTNSAIRVVNDRARPSTIEVAVNRLILPEDGQPIIEPISDEDFLIFPPQATVPAGGTQVFRIRWVGDPALAESAMYMFTTSELPIPIEGEVAAVQVLYAIQSVVTVAPMNGIVDVSVLSVERGVGPEEKAGLKVLLENKGNAHTYISQGQVRFTSGTWTKELNSAELNDAVGLGLLPPNQKRMMFFPIENVPAEGEVRAVIEPAPYR